MFSAGPGNRSSGKATALRRPALSLSGGYLPDAGGYSCEAAPLSTFHFLHPSTSIRALSRRFEKLSSPAAELPACAPCPPKVPSPFFGSAGRLKEDILWPVHASGRTRNATSCPAISCALWAKNTFPAWAVRSRSRTWPVQGSRISARTSPAVTVSPGSRRWNSRPPVAERMLCRPSYRKITEAASGSETGWVLSPFFPRKRSTASTAWQADGWSTQSVSRV